MIQLHTITSEEKKQNFDITELFEMQKELDKRIGYKGNDKMDMLFRAYQWKSVKHGTKLERLKCGAQDLEFLRMDY